MDDIKAYREKKAEEQLLRDFINNTGKRATMNLQDVVARCKQFTDRETALDVSNALHGIQVSIETVQKLLDMLETQSSCNGQGRGKSL